MCEGAGGKRDVAPLARRSIKGLGSMMGKDSCLQYQSEADAVKVTPARLPIRRRICLLACSPLPIVVFSDIKQ